MPDATMIKIVHRLADLRAALPLPEDVERALGAVERLQTLSAQSVSLQGGITGQWQSCLDVADALPTLRRLAESHAALERDKARWLFLAKTGLMVREDSVGWAVWHRDGSPVPGYYKTAEEAVDQAIDAAK